MKTELWKDVFGYKGYYKVSSTGRVKSIPRKVPNSHLKNGTMFLKGKIMNPTVVKTGYAQVMLSKNGKRKYHKVSRLVAKAFIPNPKNKPQVNHINENKLDNRLENLNWMTAKENINHGTAIERLTKKQRKNNKTIQVFQYSLSGDLIRSWFSMSEASRHGFNKSLISICCKGKRKTHKGFIWKTN